MVFSIFEQLKKRKIEFDVFNPWVDIKVFKEFEHISFLKNLNFKNKYGAIILAVGHNIFKKIGVNKIKKLVSIMQSFLM